VTALQFLKGQEHFSNCTTKLSATLKPLPLKLFKNNAILDLLNMKKKRKIRLLFPQNSKSLNEYFFQIHLSYYLK